MANDFQQDTFNAINAGLNFGQRVKGIQDQRRINQLASQGYAAPEDQRQGLLGQIAQVDARAAQQQEQAFANTDERRNTTLANMARILTTAPEQARPGLYQRMLPTLSQFGMSELPQEYNAQTAPIINQAADSIASAYGGINNQVPTDVRSFQQMTNGLSQEDRERARRISLGLDPRQSSAAISYQKVRGADGIERLVAVDPREVGAQVVGGGDAYGSFAAPAQQAQPISGGSFQAFSQLATEFPSATMTSGARSAERNAQVGGQPNSQHLAGTAADYAVPANQKPAFISRVRQMGYEAIDEGDHIHVQLPRGSRGNASANAFAGRRPEDEAAAVEAAKLGVQQQFLPQELQMRTNAALEQESGKAAATLQAEQNKTQATRTRDAQSATDLINQALQILPNATGSAFGAAWDASNAAFGRSTQGAQANASLRTIAGQLTSRMPRMEGPQSNADVQMYKEMAGDLANESLPVETRQAAAQTILSLQQKYLPQNQGGNSLQTTQRVVDTPRGSATVRRARNPQTGQTLILVNGQWVPE